MQHKDIKYQNNFITNVIFRLDFASFLNLEHNNNIDIFREKIFDILPISDNQNHSIKKINLDNLSVDNEEQKLYNFNSKDEYYKLTIQNNNLIIQCNKYSNFQIFQKIVTKVLVQFNEIYPHVSYARLGLRYVNQIVIEKGNAFAWKNYLDKSLITNLEYFLDKKENLSRVMTQMTLNDDELDCKINFTFGIFNSNFPAKIHKKEFILDYDCFTEEINNSEDIYLKMTNFNHKIKELFEKSIKDDLRNLMIIIS